MRILQIAALMAAGMLFPADVVVAKDAGVSASPATKQALGLGVRSCRQMILLRVWQITKMPP